MRPCALAVAVPACVLAAVEVTDSEEYGADGAKAPATVQECAGGYVLRAGAVEHMEPGVSLPFFVMLDFATTAAAKWRYDSPESWKLGPVRHGAIRSRVANVEALNPSAPLPS